MLANPDIGVTQIAQRLGTSPTTLYLYIPAAQAAIVHHDNNALLVNVKRDIGDENPRLDENPGISVAVPGAHQPEPLDTRESCGYGIWGLARGRRRGPYCA